MFHVGKQIVFLFFFMHAAMLGMQLDTQINNQVSLSINAGLVELVISVPDIGSYITNYLDCFSLHHFRLTCKAFASNMNKQKYHEKLLANLPDEVNNMDSDQYIKTMLFFSENTKIKTLIFENGDEICRANTLAIGHLLSFAQDLLQNLSQDPKFLVSCYEKNKQKKIFEIYKKDIQSSSGLDYGLAAIVRLIVHQTGNVNFQDEDGNTLLHYAKDPAHIQFLLGQKDVDVNVKNNKGETPLLCAILHTTKTITNNRLSNVWTPALKLLECDKTDIYAKTNEEKTVIHYMLDEKLHDETAQERYRNTIYLPHIKFWWSSLFGILIERLKPKDDQIKTDFLSTLDKDGRSAIYYAAKFCVLDAIDLLPFYVTDKDGRTLLHIAAAPYKIDGRTPSDAICVIYRLLYKLPDEIKYLRDKEKKTFVDYLYENNTSFLQHILRRKIPDSDKKILSQYSYLHSWIPFFYRNANILLFLGVAGLGALSLLCKARQCN